MKKLYAKLYFSFFIIFLARLPLNFWFSSPKIFSIFWNFLGRFFSLSLLFGHKKRKLFWLVRGCWSILIGRPIDFHISMGISNSQILIRLTPLWPSNQNTSPGHLRTWIWFFFFTRIFGWVIIMTHLNAYLLSTKTAEWIHFIQKQFKMIEK